MDVFSNIHPVHFDFEKHALSLKYQKQKYFQDLKKDFCKECLIW